MLAPPLAQLTGLVTGCDVSEVSAGCQHDASDIQPESDEEPREGAHQVIAVEWVREPVADLMEMSHCVKYPVNRDKSADHPPSLSVAEHHKQDYRCGEEGPDRTQILVLEESPDIRNLPQPEQGYGLDSQNQPEGGDHGSPR